MSGGIFYFLELWTHFIKMVCGKHHTLEEEANTKNQWSVNADNDKSHDDAITEEAKTTQATITGSQKGATKLKRNTLDTNILH